MQQNDGNNSNEYAFIPDSGVAKSKRHRRKKQVQSVPEVPAHVGTGLGEHVPQAGVNVPRPPLPKPSRPCPPPHLGPPAYGQVPVAPHVMAQQPYRPPVLPVLGWVPAPPLLQKLPPQQAAPFVPANNPVPPPRPQPPRPVAPPVPPPRPAAVLPVQQLMPAQQSQPVHNQGQQNQNNQKQNSLNGGAAVPPAVLVPPPSKTILPPGTENLPRVVLPTKLSDEAFANIVSVFGQDLFIKPGKSRFFSQGMHAELAAARVCAATLLRSKMPKGESLLLQHTNRFGDQALTIDACRVALDEFDGHAMALCGADSDGTCRHVTGLLTGDYSSVAFF
jgi:hypothetical protein